MVALVIISTGHFHCLRSGLIVLNVFHLKIFFHLFFTLRSLSPLTLGDLTNKFTFVLS